MLTFKHEPEIPPSKVSTQEPPKVHLSEALSELKVNKNFRLVAFVYAFAISPYDSFGALMALILTPFGFTVAQIAGLGAGGVFVGAFSAIGFGVFLDRTRAYKKSLVGGCILCLLLIGPIFPRLLQNDSSYGIVLTITMVYIAINIAFVPLCMSFSVEVTYPLNASVANGSIQICA